MDPNRTAYHEAGHAVASLALGKEVGFASIVPTDDAWGEVERAGFIEGMRPDVGSDPETVQEIERHILIALAGPAAEWDEFGQVDDGGDSGDWSSAADIASYLYDGEVLEKYLAFMLARARAMVATPPFRAKVKAVALALLDRTRLTGPEVVEVCDGAIRVAMAARRTVDPRG